MVEAGATWAVEYRDGRIETRFAPDGSERTWSSIDWPNVVRVAFQSADAEAEFEFSHPGPAYDVRLGSRVAMAVESAVGIDAVRALLLVTTPKGAPIAAETVQHIFFWFPDGTSHECGQYDCPDAAAYLCGLAHGHRTSLAQSHEQLAAAASVSLVPVGA